MLAYAVTRDGTEAELQHFITHFLPSFGDYQDAMVSGQPYLYHSRISAYLNAGLLLPEEVCRAAEAAYQLHPVPPRVPLQIGQYAKIMNVGETQYASENQKQVFLKPFLQGYVWRKKFFEEPGTSIATIAKEENKSEVYIARLIQFSLIAPDLTTRMPPVPALL